MFELDDDLDIDPPPRSRLVGGMNQKLSSSRKRVIDSDDDNFSNSIDYRSKSVSTSNLTHKIANPHQNRLSILQNKEVRASSSSSSSAPKISAQPFARNSTIITEPSPPDTSWKCIQCTYINESASSVCELCASLRPKDNVCWTCSYCTLLNDTLDDHCDACGKVRRNGVNSINIQSGVSKVVAKMPLNQTPSNSTSSVSKADARVSSSSIKHREFLQVEGIGLDSDSKRSVTLDHEPKKRKPEVIVLDDYDDDVESDDDSNDSRSIDQSQDEDGDGDGSWDSSDSIQNFSDDEDDFIRDQPSTVRARTHDRSASRLSKPNHDEINAPSIQTAQPSTKFLNSSFPHLSQHFRSVVDVNQSGISSINFDDFSLKTISARALELNYEKRREKRGSQREKKASTRKSKSTSSKKKRWPKYAKRK